MPAFPRSVVHSRSKIVGNKGFSLVEVLIAVVIIAILGFILLTTSGTLTQTHTSNLQTIASKIASSELETLRETNFAQLPGSGPITDPNLGKLPSGTATRTISNYQGSLLIKEVNVTVNWTWNGSPRQFQLASLIYENGI